MAMLSECKVFALRGNVIDMAVGIVIGAAFGAIVSSLVNDVIMPPIGLLVGNVDLPQLAIVLREVTAEAEAVTLNYGRFINTVLHFLIIALAIFLVVKQMNRLERRTEGPVALDSTLTRRLPRLVLVRERPLGGGPPAAMKVIVFERFGGPDELKLAGVPVPMPKDDEVQIEIHRTSVNPVD